MVEVRRVPGTPQELECLRKRKGFAESAELIGTSRGRQDDLLPPMSLPTPSKEPRMPIRAPSPPELPPQVLLESKGFVVVPNTALLVSPDMRL